jgi:ASC-1-like (ASCH) protein
MPKKKAEKGEALRLAEEVLGGEAGEQYLTAVNEIAKQLGREPREVFQSLLQIGLKAYNWGSMTIPDLIVCVDVLSYLDDKFFKRIYVESPIDSVIRQADRFSEATRKILEGYARGVVIPATRKAEGKEEGEEGREEKAKKQPQQGGVLDKIVDNVVSYISEELGARLSKEVVDAVEPPLKEALINMIKEGKVRIEITGGELLKGKEEVAEEAE